VSGIEKAGSGAAPKLVRVIDYETTGLPDSPAAEVIELARIDVDLRTGAIGNGWRSFARPRGAIPPDVKAVHHILEEDVANAPDISALWAEFWEGCGEEDVIAAHNAGFEQHFHPGGGRRWIDTYKCALTVWPDAPAHSNQTLRYWLDLDRSAGFDRAFAMPPHRALPDAYVTANILARLLRECSIADMISISAKPALLSTIGFGKHRGMKFADVPADYLEWIRDKSDLKEDVKFSAAHWLSVRSRGNRA
jgi:exodeoxyribonuclease X